MLIIPAIDLYNAECVRLYQGDEKKRTVFSHNPLEVALKWQAAGAKLLHVVDLNGAFEGSSKNLDVVSKLAAKLSIPVQLGGGIRSKSQIEQILSLGVKRVILGTIAVKNPDLVKEMAEKYPKRIILGIDARDGMMVTKGWVETSAISALDLAARYKDIPVAAIIFTDISRDGALSGPNIDSLANMYENTDIPLIASGGISGMNDLKALSDRLPDLKGAILGMSIYTNKIDLSAAINTYQRTSDYVD